MARPRVDVGVVTYNTAAVTVAALRHLLDSTDDCELRILVHDNASADGTAEAVAAAVPEAEVVAGAENLGFGRAMNLLLARSDAPWFLCLNSDAWPEPGAVGRLVAVAEASRGVGAVVPRIERPDGELEHSTNPFPSVAVAWRCAVGYRREPGGRADRMLLPGAWRHDEARVVDWAVGACWLLRREAVEAVGGFDERFFMYAEDIDWCWRLRDAGWTTWFEPTALVRHLGGTSSEPVYRGRQQEAWMRNTYRLLRWRRGRAYAAAYRVLNLAGSARAWAVAALRRDAWGRARWAGAVRSHLVSTSGPDGPPRPLRSAGASRRR